VLVVLLLVLLVLLELVVLLVALVDDELVELVVVGSSVLVTMLVDVDVELDDELLELLVDVVVVVVEVELVEVVEVVDVVLVVLVVVVGRSPQTTSACDREMKRSASGSPDNRSLTMMWSAVTVMSAVSPMTVLVCSLMTIDPMPSGSGTAWFGAPVTTIAMPFTTSPTTVELPLAEATLPVQVAVASDETTVALMLARPTVTTRFSTLASAVLELPTPSVDAARVSAEISVRRLNVGSPAESIPPLGGRGPVSTMLMGRLRSVPPIMVPRPLYSRTSAVADPASAHSRMAMAGARR
jgi:hypothetical protein